MRVVITAKNGHVHECPGVTHASFSRLTAGAVQWVQENRFNTRVRDEELHPDKIASITIEFERED